MTAARRLAAILAADVVGYSRRATVRVRRVAARAASGQPAIVGALLVH